MRLQAELQQLQLENEGKALDNEKRRIELAAMVRDRQAAAGVADSGHA